MTWWNSQGCVEKALFYCKYHVIRMLTWDQEVVYACYLFLNIIIFLMVYFVLQKINLMKLEAESLYDFHKLEIYDNTFESDDSAEFDKASEDEGGAGDKKSVKVKMKKAKSHFSFEKILFNSKIIFYSH